MIGILLTGLNINGISYPMGTDYRNILVFLTACNDPDFTAAEKLEILMRRLYRDGFYEILQEHMEEAVPRTKQFMDCGQGNDDKKLARKMMDWEQGEPILFPAINKMAGMKTRAAPCIHWWTSSGYFMEIGEGTFSTVLGIQRRKARNRKLGKWEQESYRNNKKLYDVRRRYTEEGQAEIEYWNKLLS